MTFLLSPTTTRDALKGTKVLTGQVCCDCRWKGQRHRPQRLATRGTFGYLLGVKWSKYTSSMGVKGEEHSSLWYRPLVYVFQTDEKVVSLFLGGIYIDFTYRLIECI